MTLLEDLGDAGLFRAEWNPQFMGIMRAVAESDVIVLSATGSREGRAFELRADADDALSAFHRRCEELGVPATLTRLGQVSERSSAESAYDLTPEQREALRLAFEEGYYEEPRETDLDALATQLGITRQAFAARLRRGYRNLVGDLLVPKERDGE